MALQMGPFGVPTRESVFADYEEKQRKESISSLNKNINLSINYGDDEYYDYCDELYDLLENENNLLKSEIEKLNERLNQLENSQLINVIVRI